MNRRTLDMALPTLYVIAILIAVYSGGARAVSATAAIGGMLIGLHWAALRHNLKA